MSFWNNRTKYGKIILDFLAGHIDGEGFERAFTDIWRKDRDEALLTYSVENHIDFESFEKRTEDEKNLDELLERIFTACDVFDPNDDTRKSYEYNESTLREYVNDICSKQQKLFNGINEE